jgi:hypothetical protein
MTNNSNSFGIYKARTIGSLFLIAFLAYGFGRNLFESEAQTAKYIGAFLILTNSIIVLFIGILLRKTLVQYNTLTGYIYLFTRLIEAIALASIILNLIPNISISNDNGYFFAMLVLGLGSIPMCLTIYKKKIVPNWLGVWGTIGYTILAFGFLMEFFGKEWSMYLLILGGLWELTFGIWLILKDKKQKD